MLDLNKYFSLYQLDVNRRNTNNCKGLQEITIKVSANQVKSKLDTHEAACQWKAPSDYPDDDDDKRYVWNEDNQTWEER